MNNLNGKKIFMTGSTSGFGKVAALEMANNGASVLTTFRNQEKADALLNDFKRQYPNAAGSIDFVQCDLNAFDSINKACTEVGEKINGLDMIVNNAGIMNPKFKESADGIEQTLHVNLLAPALILHNLSDLLKGSEEPKIINTASALHQGVIRFDDPEFKKGFKSMDAYRQSKLGIILLGRLLSVEKAHANINVYSLHPGVIRTEISRDFNFLMRGIFWLMGKSPEKGAETLLHLVENPADSLEAGEYYTNKKVSSTTPESHDLKMAEQMMAMIKEYLKGHINKPSFLFD
ncbi:MAG: SDR family NAD(P)-dependent oxidoreductase [Bacteroidetes bacterium]|nr:MAG: SDR family NAD(P)-dependent oxidoreductase [Bacteroidota bacterium]